MRIMSLDVGSQTIGVAVSDPFGWTAQGVETIRHTTREKEFARELAEAFPDIPYHFWDERLTTVMAQRELIAADVSRKKRKKVIDKMAAVVILQGYLDHLSMQKKGD